MSRYPLWIIGTIILLLGSFTVYSQQNNNVSLSELNSQLDNIQVQVRRGFSPDLPELTDQQQQALEEARQQLWEARKQLLVTQQEVGLITEEEAQYYRDHLELMNKYEHDYDPPSWGWGMMGMGGFGMMGRPR